MEEKRPLVARPPRATFPERPTEPQWATLAEAAIELRLQLINASIPLETVDNMVLSWWDAQLHQAK